MLPSSPLASDLTPTTAPTLSPVYTQSGRAFLNTLTMGPLTSSGAVDKGPVDHLVAILRHKWLDDLWFLEKGRDSLAAAAPMAKTARGCCRVERP